MLLTFRSLDSCSDSTAVGTRTHTHMLHVFVCMSANSLPKAVMPFSIHNSSGGSFDSTVIRHFTYLTHHSSEDMK